MLLNGTSAGLAMLPTGFASCSNDAVVKVWAMDGDLQAELHGHTAFVYSISASEDGHVLATCGEDRTLRVWVHGACVQALSHPAPSVWCVAVLPNGDLVTGASDGVARVFTACVDRMAPVAMVCVERGCCMCLRESLIDPSCP